MTVAMSASAQPIPRESLGGQFLEIGLPLLSLLGSEPVEIVPAVDPAVVHVVEDELDGIIADRLHADNLYLALARHSLALGRAVTLDLGRRARHPQVFGRQVEGGA